MLREDVKYEGKRTNSLLKYKKMHDEEYKVIDIIKGSWREISKETKLEKTIETMVAVIIDYKDTKLMTRYINEKGKMIPSRITNIARIKQKELSTAIKRARFLALLSYTKKYY